MLVGSVANRTVPTVHPEDAVVLAARRLAECRCALVPVVVDEPGGARVVGVLRDRDVFVAAYGSDDVPVHAVMSEPACTCRASDSLGMAIRLLRRKAAEAAPVVDGDGYLVGILSFTDLLREAAR